MCSVAGRVDIGVGRGEPHPSPVGQHEHPARIARSVSGSPQPAAPAMDNSAIGPSGKHHDINDITVVPQPSSLPHPPIYMGVSWNEDRPVKQWTGDIASSPGVVLDVEEHLHMRNIYDTPRRRDGPRPTRLGLPMFIHTLIADSKQQAVDDAREGLMWMYNMIDFRRTVHHGSDMHYDFPTYYAEHPDPPSPWTASPTRSPYWERPKRCGIIRGLNREDGVGYYGCDFGFGGLPHAKVNALHGALRPRSPCPGWKRLAKQTPAEEVQLEWRCVSCP